MASVFSEDELVALERERQEGLSSEEIVMLFAGRGVKFSEASLRKYVQLGLLPRSRRVALKDKQRGSLGLYPATVVRRVQWLKQLLETYSIEQIQREFLFVRADVEELERSLQRIFSSLSQATSSGVGGVTSKAAARELAEARAMAAKLVAKITGIETRLALEARTQRAAM